ncbi:MAG: hypothetical protein ACW97Z_01425 [Candidatus Hodarchaeales archaeon]|jgi:pyruvate formate-lyase activating enzyme-like uncharacterized protein
MNKKPEKTNWGSAFAGPLSKGCRQCILGEKLVVLVSTKCSSNCFYCPLSNERKEANTSFANERPFSNISDLLVEALHMEAKGASMTGGDPLELHSFDKTLSYCKVLKEQFSNDFHIHAYTRGKDLNRELLARIVPFLDEIRFHVINFEKDFPNVQLTTEFDVDVGIEIPVIPTKGIDYYKRLIREFESIIPERDHFYFINLNELELSETNYRKILSHRLEVDKVNLSAVKDSSKLAIKIVDWASQNTKIPVHYCALATKDNVQLPNRLFRMAMNIKLPSDVVVEEGTDRGLLIRGVIKASDYDLEEVKRYLVLEADVPANLVHIDHEKKRLLTNAAILEEISQEIISKFPKIIVGMAEEYPSHDNLQTTFIPFN